MHGYIQTCIFDVSKGATVAPYKNLTLKKMNVNEILEKANGLLKQPAKSWRYGKLTQIPMYCSHGVTSTLFSIWFGNKTGQVYVNVFGHGIYIAEY